jgi:hypothetical protein
MTTTQDTAIPLADNVIGASQGGHGLGPTSLSGRIALLTRFAELVAAHAEVGHARCRIQRPSAALGAEAVVGRRLGTVAHADAGRAAAVTDGVRKNPEHPTAPMRRAGRFAAFTPPFNMSGQPAISLPVHRNVEDLPIGIQLAAYGRDDILVRVASQLRSAHPWSPVHPVIPDAAVRDIESFVRHPTLGQPTCMQPRSSNHPIAKNRSRGRRPYDW